MKPIGILFDSYFHYRTWINQKTFKHFERINWATDEWKLANDENRYIAIIPDTSVLEEDSFDRFNKYQSIEFKDILDPNYEKIESLPSWLKYRIR